MSDLIFVEGVPGAGKSTTAQFLLWASNPLLPLSPNMFDVEAWPFRVSFEPDGSALRWHGPRLWWGGPEGVYAGVTPKESR